MNNLSQYDAVRNNGVQSGQYNQRSYPPRHDNQRNYQDHRQIEQATRFNEYNKKETQSDAHRSFENTSSANRGNDGYGQGQEFRQTNGATEFKQMDNREDSSRYYGNQERRGSGYNYQRQENERRTENRGGYRANSRPNFETNFNQRQEHRSDSQHRFGNTLSANRGKDGFEQGQKFRPAQRDTELNRMNNREDSSRYYENQQRRGSGYDSRRPSPNYRGQYEFRTSSRSPDAYARSRTNSADRSDYQRRNSPVSYRKNRSRSTSPDYRGQYELRKRSRSPNAFRYNDSYARNRANSSDRSDYQRRSSPDSYRNNRSRSPSGQSERGGYQFDYRNHGSPTYSRHSQPQRCEYNKEARFISNDQRRQDYYSRSNSRSPSPDYRGQCEFRKRSRSPDTFRYNDKHTQYPLQYRHEELKRPYSPQDNQAVRRMNNCHNSSMSHRQCTEFNGFNRIGNESNSQRYFGNQNHQQPNYNNKQVNQQRPQLRQWIPSGIQRQQYPSSGQNNGAEKFGKQDVSLPVPPIVSDSQANDGWVTLGKGFDFEELLNKDIEELRDMNWAEEVEKEYIQQQLEKKAMNNTN